MHFLLDWESNLARILCTVVLFCAAAIVSAAQSLTTLAHFELSDGLQPGPLTLGADGNFYGTTSNGGNLNACDGVGCGTIFKVTPGGALTTLYSFNGVDGIFPQTLVLGSDGNFYGMTVCSFPTGGRPSLPQPSFGPPSLLRRMSAIFCTGPGSIFRISPNGTLVFLHTFSGPDGSSGSGALVEASDGNFYGASGDGGANNDGTVFKMTPSGMLTVLHTFSGAADGAFPEGGLVQATDGNFYGTTGGGGSSNNCNPEYDCGTVFTMTPGGTLTTLHTFSGVDGAQPNGNLVQGIDGNFYGTTFLGGVNNNCNPENACGTIFEMTPGGTLATVYNFSGMDGANPNAGLMQASDGNFYGSTAWGGEGYSGVAFRFFAPLRILNTLHSFCTSFNCTDGEVPSRLVQGPSGVFYGATSLGGDLNCNNGGGCGTVFSLSAATPTPNKFVPVPPCRLVDTRQRSPIQGATFSIFDVRGLAQTQGCGDLSSATSYSLNVTAVPHGRLSYLTIWPTGQPQPYVSTLNSPDGRTKASAAIVPAGGSGAVSIYATDTTDVILDIDGYFTSFGSQALQFYPLPPCRVVDTRGVDGPLGGPRLAHQQERDFPLLMSSCIPLGLNPVAYSLNFTAVPNPSGQQLGYLTVWPFGETQPTVSTLNNPTGTVVANAAIVSAGQGGEIAVYPDNTTDLLIDINGYFAAEGQGGYSFYPVTPCRAYDSRGHNGQPFSGEQTVDIVDSACAPSGTAAAYVFNATVVPNGWLGYLTLWADGEMQPLASTLNAYDGFVTSNMAIVPNINGLTDAYASGSTQLILDIAGYFAP